MPAGMLQQRPPPYITRIYISPNVIVRSFQLRHIEASTHELPIIVGPVPGHAQHGQPIARRPAVASKAQILAMQRRLQFLPCHDRSVGRRLSHRLPARNLQAWPLGESTHHGLEPVLVHDRNAYVRRRGIQERAAGEQQTTPCPCTRVGNQLKNGLDLIIGYFWCF